MNFRVGPAAAFAALLVFSTVTTAVYGGARTEQGLHVTEERGQFHDLETSESGYIYRTDGQGPPVFIKLGEGNDEKFDAILESEYIRYTREFFHFYSLFFVTVTRRVRFKRSTIAEKTKIFEKLNNK